MFLIFAYFWKQIFAKMQKIFSRINDTENFCFNPCGKQRKGMLGLENIKKNKQFTNDYIAYCFCLSII